MLRRGFFGGLATLLFAVTAAAQPGPVPPASDLRFGTGTDGALTCSSGTTTLTHNGNYTTITPTGTCKINTSGYNLYASILLDLSNAGAQAIYNAAAAGNNASGATGAIALTSSQGANTTPLFFNTTASAGGNGGTGAGTAGTAGAQSARIAGGSTTAGGTGGAGGTGAGGAGGGAPATLTVGNAVLQLAPVGSSFIAAGVQINGGVAGGSGGGGGGDTINSGGGGGGNGQAGLQIYIAAYAIARGTNSTTGIIQAIGGLGGNGANGVAGNTGGGGGGSGGGGGFVQIVAGSLTGSTITNAIDVSGGKAGNGGNGVGTGLGGLIVAGGNGGGAAITVLSPASGPTNTLVGNSIAGSAGTAPSGATGGTGGLGAVAKANL